MADCNHPDNAQETESSPEDCHLPANRDGELIEQNQATLLPGTSDPTSTDSFQDDGRTHDTSETELTSNPTETKRTEIVGKNSNTFISKTHNTIQTSSYAVGTAQYYGQPALHQEVRSSDSNLPNQSTDDPLNTNDNTTETSRTAQYSCHQVHQDVRSSYSNLQNQSTDHPLNTSGNTIQTSTPGTVQNHGQPLHQDARTDAINRAKQNFEVCFHFYVPFDAEEVTIDIRPIPQSLKLSCCDESQGYGKLWRSANPVFVEFYSFDAVEYRYTIKPHHGFLYKAYQYVTRQVQENIGTISYKLSERKHQYDIHNKSHENRDSCDYAFDARFCFVKMLHDGIDENGHNLKEQIMECEHVVFGFPNPSTENQKIFFEWVKEAAESSSCTPYKSAYICALLGQYARKSGDKLGYYLERENYEEAVRLLFSRFRKCPAELLSQHIFDDINRVGLELLSSLEYVTTFSHLFELDELLCGATNAKKPANPKHYGRIAREVIQGPYFQGANQTAISKFMLRNVPNINCLWIIYDLLEVSCKQSVLEDNEFIGRFLELLDYERHPEITLQESGVWEKMPKSLKPKLAQLFLDALINEIKRKPLNESCLTDLLLDKELQEYGSSSVIQLLKHLASSKDATSVQIVSRALKSRDFAHFWEKQEELTKLEIAFTVFEGKLQSEKDKHTGKQKVVATFKALQYALDINALGESETLIKGFEENVFQMSGLHDLTAVVDAYEEVQKSSKKVAMQMYFRLLIKKLEKQHLDAHLKSKLISKIFPEATVLDPQPILIDRGREKVLVFLLEQTKLQTLAEASPQSFQTLVDNNVQFVLPDKTMWSVIFRASGEVSYLHDHKNYITVKRLIGRLCDAVINGYVPLDFLKCSKDQKVIDKIWQLMDCKSFPHQNWRRQRDLLLKEREEFRIETERLKNAIGLVGTCFRSLIDEKDFHAFELEYDHRMKKMPNTHFVDIRKENYWGPLENIRGPAKKLQDLYSSKLFINFTTNLAKEDVYVRQRARESAASSVAEEVRMTVEGALLLASNESFTKFFEVLEKLSKEDGSILSEELDRLFSGPKENVKQEFTDSWKLFHADQPSSKVLLMLVNYGEYKHFKKKVQAVLKCMNPLGHHDAQSKAPSQSFQMLHSFVNCNQSETLFSISKKMENLKGSKLITILRKLEPDVASILNELSEATELITFIAKTAKDNMVFLIDACGKYSDLHIQEYTVSNFVDVHRFLSCVLSNKPENPGAFLNQIVDAHSNFVLAATKPEKSHEARINMAAKIKDCSRHVHNLKLLYKTLSNRGELAKERIKRILREGCYHIEAEKGGSFQVLLTYASEDKKSNTENHMKRLIDLRSRALLFVSAFKSDRTHVKPKARTLTSDELYQFIHQVDLITEITRKYDALRRSGIPDYQGSFWTKLQSTDEIKQEEARANKELTDWNSMLRLVREECFFLNFFHATQIWELTSFFQKPQSEKEISDRVLALFRCIDSRVSKKDLPYFQTKYKHPKKTDIQSELHDVGTALEEIFGSSQQKPLPIIESPKKTDAIVEPGKLYVGVLQPGSTQTVHVIMALFLNTCASLPKPRQLLFCHSQTTWEEIELFLFRTFPAHKHGLKTTNYKLHCLANVESLPNDIQFQLVDNLRRLTDEVKSPYLLAIICRGGSHHHIADQFGELTHYFGGMADSEMKKRFQQECSNTFFVTSEMPGLGKSEEICSHAAGRGKSLLTFPISGPFSRKYLVGRLCGLQVKKFQALHFEIGEVDDPNGLDTFLFELIVTGMVSSEAQFFSLPTNHIYIEIANTLQQRMRDSLPICKCFQKLVVKWKDCRNLISSKELTSPVQVVCQYLKAYDGGMLESQEIVLSGPNKVQPLDSSMCGTLLSKHFFSGEDLSFNILQNFISVLANQLMQFSRSFFLKPENLEYMIGKSHDVRVRLFTALLEVATSFAARSVSTCKATQSEALAERRAKGALPTSREGNTAAEMVNRVSGMIHWADNERFVIMLHGDGTVTAIYRDIEKLPQGVIHLFKSQSIKGKGLEDYKTMSQEELQTRLERISNAPERPNREELESLSYALTPDNILKMALIIQRIQANIPVIIMGETGCGKTSLVQYLAKTCKTPFCVFNLHAGITEEEIIDFISSKDQKARKLQKERKSLWVFLDEINTCDYLGTINEIVCHRSLHGKPLSPNLVFIAACNPYRLRPPGRIMTAGLSGKTTLDEYSKLVYRVHPLPETMIDYVWDYGSLSEKDEKAYINRMVEGLFGVKYSKLLVELLAASQDFVRRADESSFCVSLRDVHRTTILIKWFHKMLANRPSVHRPNISSRFTNLFSTASKVDVKDHAIVLSLAHCYLSRLPKTDLRQEYCKKMSKIFQKNGRHSFSNPNNEFEQIIRAEQEDWLLRMELPPGTARNAALRENVFVILVCILNRMPVFVVGKPGCSKSLSMQIITNNLRGRDSKDPFLKTLPQLFVVSFQGSESSTSEGIEKVFEKARKYKNEEENVLPVVLLDEIGLAEVSKFNPLKVLHRLLEPGKGQFPDVAVVGISNWALDAAKMNRAIHLSRPDPDEDDLYETGLSIRKAQMDKPGERQTLINSETLCLAKAYHRYQSRKKLGNFHGLRDYYSMVKCFEISVSKPEDNNRKLQKAMQRNFGGNSSGKSELQKMFSEELKKCDISQNVLQFPVAELIRDNLHDSLARHLMIITNGDSAIGILNKTLADLNKEKITIFGSRFEEDLSADYNHRVLSRIILCMEQNCVLILRDLEGIYGSLYDMLNQNYIVVGGKKNCRIALGAYSNPLCQVDDGFRCIVLVDENKVDYSDPPFLNRFEKQLLRFSDVLDAKQKEITEELREWVKKISTVTGQEKEFSEVDMFAGFHEDTLPSLVLFHSQDQHEIDKQDVIAQCKNDLMFIATPDAVIRARKSHLYNSNEEKAKSLFQDYFEKPIHHGLKVFLQQYLDNQDEHPKSMKFFVMTYSSIHTDVSKYVEGVFDVQTEKLSFFKSEKEFSKRVQHFWRKSKANLLAVQCRPDSDAPHMLLVRSIIEREQKEYIDSLQGSKYPKHVCIVIHLRREAAIEEDQRSYRWQFNFLSGWRQVMIDVLERPVIQIKEVLESSIGDVLDSETMPFNKFAADQLLWCFTRIKYPPSKQPAIPDTKNLVQIITTSCAIMDCFKRLCCAWIENIRKNSESWLVSVACERKILINCSTLEKAMECFVAHLVRRPLTKVIFFVQKESAWKALTEGEDRTQEVCLYLLSLGSIFAMDDIPDSQGAESLSFNVSHLELIFPFSYLFYKRIDCLKELFLQEYRRQCNVKENLDDQDELTKSAKSSLILRVSIKVQQKITEMLDSDYLVSHISEYVDDVLDIKSEEFSLHLTRIERISILKAYFANGLPTITAEETPNALLLITQLHSLFWMDEDTVAPLLHYIQACMPQLQLSIDDIVNAFYEADNESGDNDMELHDTEDATFETFVVEKICASLFPTDEVVQSTGGIQAWKNVSSNILSETITFGVQVKAFYILKVCNDFSSLIPSEPKTLSHKLYALGHCMELDNHLDSERIFELTCEFVEDLRDEDGADEEKLDEFLFVFYGRCIESNPDTPLMGEILKQITSTRDERLLQLAVPILYRIFRTEEAAFSPEHFGRLLDSPEDLEDFPNLIKVDEALSELQASNMEELDCHFNVICCDLINKMVFENLNLNEVSSSSDPVVHNFHKAAEILSSFYKDSKCSAMLGFVCAVSYLRAFIFHIAKFIIEHRKTLSTGDHDSLLRYIFSDLEEESLSTRKRSVYFLLIKELRQHLNIYEIRHLVDDFEILHYLKSYVSSGTPPGSERKISNSPFQSLAAETEVERALCKYKDSSDSSSLEDVLGNVMASKERRMELAAVVFEKFYIVRSIRNLKDTEDEVAKYITDKLGPDSNPYKNLLLRLANRESFKCAELEVNPECKPKDVEVAALVQHLSAIITSRCLTGKSKNPVACCLIEPEMMNNSFILAAPLDGSGYRCYEYFETIQRENVFLFLCSTCGLRFTAREKESAMKCPNCNSSCEIKQMKHKNFSLKAEKGYLYCEPESMHDEMLCARNLNPVEFRILHLIMHAALFAGYSLDLTSKTLAEFMKVENPSEVCFQYIQIDLDVLSAIMCCTQEKIIALLHQVLIEASVFLTKDSSLPIPHDEKTRLSWESCFSKLVRPFVQKFRQNQLKPTNKSSDETNSLEKDLESQIEELEEPQFPDIKSRNACLPRLFRIKHENSFEKLREFYLNSSGEVKENHQLLGLFLDYHTKLSRVGKLVALNAWSNRVDALLSRSLSRSEAKGKNIYDAVISKEIERLRIGKESSEENPVIQAFQNFCKAWDDVVPLFNDNLDDNEHITKMSPVGLCLVERQDLGQYLCSTLVGLAELQNEFLDKCLAIAATGKCPALQFLAKRGSKCSFPSVHVQDAKEKEVIRYEWTDRFLDHSQHNLEYGHGTEIIYDLAKIEKDLAGSFLLGKAYLTISKGLREFVFSKQLFHDCANILNELDEDIPQEELPKDVERGLSSIADKKLNDMQVLLQHMEIVLCFVKRTGGHPDDGLLDYVEKLMTESRPFPKELLPKTQGGIRLKHVCALYEFLEDKLAVSAPECVPPGYKQAIPVSAKSQIKNLDVLKENETLLDATATAIKRFIFRFLNMKPPPDADDSLVEFMKDPSLWPISIRMQLAQSEFRVSKDVRALFPKMLTIAHTYEVHEYYHDLYKKLLAKKNPLHQARPKLRPRKAGRVGGGYT